MPAVADKKHGGASVPIEKPTARAAGVGRSGGGGREQKAEDILYAVRVMRAERDELRRIVKAKCICGKILNILGVAFFTCCKNFLNAV